jgi:hypothetical protein
MQVRLILRVQDWSVAPKAGLVRALLNMLLHVDCVESLVAESAAPDSTGRNVLQS